MGRYAKFIVAALTAGLVALGSALSDGEVSQAEWIVIALAVLGAIGVYAIPNTPPVSSSPPSAFLPRERHL